MLQLQDQVQTPNGAALLRREDCAKALTRAGYRISPKTLATKASRGGGPPYHKFGRAVLYRWSEVLAWAEARLSPPFTSSSQANAVRSTGP
jgi:hypothetical protein